MSLQPILAFLIPFISVFIVQPAVAQVAIAKNFTANPESKLPGIPLLSLGGISIFIGISLAIALICTKEGFVEMHDLLAALIIILFSGFLIETNLALRYFRLTIKILAAVIVAVRMHNGPEPIFRDLPIFWESAFQIFFLLGFMFVFHRLTNKNKTLFLAGGIFNALLLGIYFLIKSGNEDSFMIVSFSLAGSLSGIIAYSRYALFNKKPLPLIGHTGIYLSSIILGSLWLHFLATLAA